MWAKINIKKWTKFWKRIVLGTEEIRNKEYYQLCKCTCWKEVWVRKHDLLRWKSTQCKQCRDKEWWKEKRKPIKKWTKFWEWVTLWKQRYEPSTQELCKCSCWKEVRVSRTHLVSWSTTMCSSCANRIRNTKHWFAPHNNNTRFYRIFMWIKRRCYNPNYKEYYYYWWRWIRCEWETFEQFKEDMYEEYEKHCKEFWIKQTTIDRIDNDWNYCKDNCRWATYKEQAKDNYLHKRALLNKEIL